MRPPHLSTVWNPFVVLLSLVKEDSERLPHTTMCLYAHDVIIFMYLPVKTVLVAM